MVVLMSGDSRFKNRKGLSRPIITQSGRAQILDSLKIVDYVIIDLPGQDTKAKENWLNHELFNVTKKQPKVLTALSSMINNYSGWHWLNHDPQTPTKIHARNRLNDITQPTLILVGNDDLTYFHNISNVLAKGITGSQKIILPN